MKKLNGITAPSGAGVIIEVHVDLTKKDPRFQNFLNNLGFEDDPFSLFYPEGYEHHMTGRMRSKTTEVQSDVEGIKSLAQRIVTESRSQDCPLYVEIELARSTYRHANPKEGKLIDQLSQFQFLSTGQLGGAGADIHVEFPARKVSNEVRQYFLQKLFYWVATPDGPHFGAEEIATLQTETYASALRVYRQLISHPFPECTAVHLEQKLGMLASHEGLTMPEIIAVK